MKHAIIQEKKLAIEFTNSNKIFTKSNNNYDKIFKTKKIMIKKIELRNHIIMYKTKPTRDFETQHY